MTETTVFEPLLTRDGGAVPLPGAALPWLESLRESGLARFRELGLPNQKVEAWKYTSLRPLEKLRFVPADGAAVSVDRLPRLLPSGESGHRLVFVQGCFRADLSSLGDLPDGVTLSGLGAALAAEPAALEPHLGRLAPPDGQALLALNTALMEDGLVLRIGAGVRLAMPIEVVFLGVGGDPAPAYHPRNLIVLEPNSQATLVEHHASLGGEPYLSNAVTEIEIGEGAALHHYRVQEEATAALQISTLHARLARRAVYDGFTLTTGGRLVRNESSIALAGEHAECHFNGAYMLRGEQHCDNTTVIDHQARETSCREVFKGVLDDKARGVFQGRIVVRPEAQKADGHQLSRTLLLSDKAEVDTKPELKIYADDVKCSHGATSGDLDHDALFYLRSRGIPEETARHILIEAFLAETIKTIATEGLCPALLASVGHWLSSATERGVR
ncbi:MAG TPA: Fe-S cluster assembly protein SufD [Kiloniellales bacterium]|nr:Fe-S cluster assembly protein SufD [Kiloniellales bacterium]